MLGRHSTASTTSGHSVCTTTTTCAGCTCCGGTTAGSAGTSSTTMDGQCVSCGSASTPRPHTQVGGCTGAHSCTTLAHPPVRQGTGLGVAVWVELRVRWVSRVCVRACWMRATRTAVGAGPDSPSAAVAVSSTSCGCGCGRCGVVSNPRSPLAPSLSG
uniref:Uncharacterized protein n=1 Tax=Lygus hesperus TaxID=30085 RepID=A0A146KUG6_LYGHE